MEDDRGDVVSSDEAVLCRLCLGSDEVSVPIGQHADNFPTIADQIHYCTSLVVSTLQIFILPVTMSEKKMCVRRNDLYRKYDRQNNDVRYTKVNSKCLFYFVYLEKVHSLRVTC